MIKFVCALKASFNHHSKRRRHAKAYGMSMHRFIWLTLEKEIEMEMVHIFPIALICLDFCAALVYIYQHDYRRGIYWLAAATLTTTVTF